MDFHVYAIRYEACDRTLHTVAVSAESEYGAVKRLVGNRHVVIYQIEQIEGRAPKWAERYIEGFCEHTFTSDTHWEYT
jgi:hypothetical protein